MQKIKVFAYTGITLIFIAVFASPAWAVKQKYRRSYQKKTPYIQEKTPYFQERNLPNSLARINVSRDPVKVISDYQPVQTAFKIGGQNIKCRSANTLSCTYFDVVFSAETECEKSQVVLKVTEKQKMTVEISSLYPKGSCRFDKILKHELSHANAYRKIVSNLLEEAKQTVTAEYTTGQKDSKGCEDIQKKITAAVSALNAKYREKIDLENTRLDNEKGGHKYGFEACEALTENEK